jgi:hypothetical protein
MKTAVETFTTSEGTGGYNNKPLNQFKITMKTAVEWLQEQYNQCPKYEEKIHDEDWDKALEMEKEQQGKFTIDFINWLHLNKYKYNPKAKLYQKHFINETLFFSIDELFITKQQEQ